MKTKILQMNFSSGKMEPVKDASLEVGQIIWLNGYGQNKFSHERVAVYKVEAGINGHSKFYTVNLDTFVKSFRNAWEVKHESQIFGIGTYYTTGDMATPEEIENALAISDQKATEKKLKDEEANRITEERRIKGTEVLKQLIPSWAKAVIIACERENESDPMSDYFSSTTVRTVILGFSKHTRDLFPELRKAAANFEGTKKYSVEPEYTGKPEDKEYWRPEDEHREKYSMGSGYYLGESKYNGWIVKKVKIFNLDSFIKEYALIASDPGNIKIAPEQPQPENRPRQAGESGDYQIIDYSPKAIAVKGDTKAIKEQLSSMGGRFNKYLTHEGERFAGWIFPKTKTAEVQNLIDSLK
jgi:hypothetical protein